MHYDPVKNVIRKLIRRSVVLRRLFYRLLGLLFLREWYVKRTIRRSGLENKIPLSILDAGSGFGQYTWYCARRFPHASILGIELDETHVKDCRSFAARSGLDALQYLSADLLNLNEKSRYDLILCIDVLEHIEKDDVLMKNLGNALRPSGVLIITTPSLSRRHRDDSAFVGEHVREGYSSEGIEQKLQVAGFNQIHAGPMYGLWGDLAWRLSIRNTMRLAGYGILGRLAAVPYMALTFPFALIGMWIDFMSKKTWGTGLIVSAEKR
jgi:SAM-dependent methyltransferase